jgi:RecB family exonuclease
LLEVVEIERGRLATMLAGQSAPGDHFSGYLGDHPGSQATLLARLGGSLSHPLSASQLEVVARCPFQDFARRVLRIDAEGEAQDDVDPRGRGDLAHICFESAMRALIDSGIVPYRAMLAADAEAIARDHARAAAEAWQAKSAIDPALARNVADQTVDQVAAMVRALYESDDHWTPTAAEHAFGEEGGWPALAVPDPAGGPPIHVRGRVDLVDRRGDALRVSDLKTGGKDRLEASLRPRELAKQSLQLPLYAAAARRCADGILEADARFLVLREASMTPTVRETVAEKKAWREDGRTPDDVADVLDASGRPTSLAARVHELVAQMRDGDHRALPAADACRICDHLSICRLPIGAPERDDP